MAKLAEGWYWFKGDIVDSGLYREEVVCTVEVMGDWYENRINVCGFLIPQECFSGKFIRTEKPEGW